MAPKGGSTLGECLGEALAKDQTFQFHHISTPPTRCEPLFAAPPGRKPERTYCESNFLTVSISKENNDTTIVFAIEVLVYTTRRLTTIFISKADSTGCLVSLGSSKTTQSSPIRVIASAFISWLVETRQRSHARLVVSLFARAQDQYLFPGSVENRGKHVLDDRQLVKWWCKTLDPVLRRRRQDTAFEADGQTAEKETEAKAYVIVPGFDKHETTAFFPASWRSDPVDNRKWQYGHPLTDIAPVPVAPPRCLVPRFPDDPKSRFVDELDEEIPDSISSQTLASPSKKGSGMWRSVKTLEQFWETMAFRQECSSGRMVGFIWIVFTPADLNPSPVAHSTLSSRASTPLPDPLPSEMLSPSSRARERKRKRPLTGPILPRAPKIKSNTTANLSSQPPDSPFWKWPLTARGQIVVDKQAYDRVFDLLLKLDFCDARAAQQSTRKWLDEVRVTAGEAVVGSSWGQAVTGRKESVKSSDSNGVGTADQPRDLSMSIVRKKTKPGSEATVVPDVERTGTDAPVVNVLGGGMIRKKPKVR